MFHKGQTLKPLEATAKRMIVAKLENMMNISACHFHGEVPWCYAGVAGDLFIFAVIKHCKASFQHAHFHPSHNKPGQIFFINLKHPSISQLPPV